MEWTEEVIARLRALWDEGHSTAEIGRRLGVSKNAVVGKAHRLNLPARPSPIRRDAGGTTDAVPRPRRVAGPTLPPLASAPVASGVVPGVAPAPAPPPRPIHRPSVAAAQPADRAQMVAAEPVPRPVIVPRPRPAGRVVACCWPIGEPGTRSFRFCDAEATHGKPYCGPHAELAYVKVRDRREDAA